MEDARRVKPVMVCQILPGAVRDLASRFRIDTHGLAFSSH
jgi:hypothetical protein